MKTLKVSVAAPPGFLVSIIPIHIELRKLLRSFLIRPFHSSGRDFIMSLVKFLVACDSQTLLTTFWTCAVDFVVSSEIPKRKSG